jgi:hypothetical protein
MILLMELIILGIFEAQANDLNPPFLYPTSLSIRLLQSSQLSSHDRLHCVENTIEKCKLKTNPIGMEHCVHNNFIPCIVRKIEFPTNPAKVRWAKTFLAKFGLDKKEFLTKVQVEEFLAKVGRFQEECERLCFMDEKVAGPHHASCLVNCLERNTLT